MALVDDVIAIVRENHALTSHQKDILVAKAPTLSEEDLMKLKDILFRLGTAHNKLLEAELDALVSMEHKVHETERKEQKAVEEQSHEAEAEAAEKLLGNL